MNLYFDCYWHTNLKDTGTDICWVGDFCSLLLDGNDLCSKVIDCKYFCREKDLPFYVRGLIEQVKSQERMVKLP